MSPPPRRCPPWLPILVVASLVLSLQLTYQAASTFPVARRGEPPQQQGGGVGPRFSIVCRMYSGTAPEWWQAFVVGHQLFWPRAWTNSDVVVVLDAESAHDWRVASVLSRLPPFPAVVFEAKPGPGVLCASFRSEGYCRQMYSNFFADRQTEADFVGFVDSDTMFITPVAVGDLFVGGKPRVSAYNGCCTGWNSPIERAIGGKPVAEFMTSSSFPFIVHRAHFAPMRAHIARTLGAATFDDAFHTICAEYGEQYSQYDLMGHYLWYAHRDDYAWHFRAPRGHDAFQAAQSDDADVLAAMQTRPAVSLMKMIGHSDFGSLLTVWSDYVCVAANWTAPGCPLLAASPHRDAIEDGVHWNMFVDWNTVPGAAAERGLPLGQKRFYPRLETPVDGYKDLARRRQAHPDLW